MKMASEAIVNQHFFAYLYIQTPTRIEDELSAWRIPFGNIFLHPQYRSDDFLSQLEFQSIIKLRTRIVIDKHLLQFV